MCLSVNENLNSAPNMMKIPNNMMRTPEEKISTTISFSTCILQEYGDTMEISLSNLMEFQLYIFNCLSFLFARVASYAFYSHACIHI